MIRRAIERFEPRLKPGTLEVSTREDKTTSGATLTYEIRADMWAQPVPMELYLRSEVNIATGELTLERTA
jgi:type VI secretion system protein ImpF